MQRLLLGVFQGVWASFIVKHEGGSGVRDMHSDGKHSTLVNRLGFRHHDGWGISAVLTSPCRSWEKV